MNDNNVGGVGRSSSSGYQSGSDGKETLDKKGKKYLPEPDNEQDSTHKKCLKERKAGKIKTNIEPSMSIFTEDSDYDSSDFDYDDEMTQNTGCHPELHDRQLFKNNKINDDSDSVFDSGFDSGFDEYYVSSPEVEAQSFLPSLSEAEEQSLAQICKDLSLYGVASKKYLNTLFSLYKEVYGDQKGEIKFFGDCRSIEYLGPNLSLGTEKPDYTFTSDVGWNPLVIRRALKEGTPDQQNTLILNVVMSDGFKDLLEGVMQKPDSDKNTHIRDKFFASKIFDDYKRRYDHDPRNFVTFKWTGWNTKRHEGRIFKSNENMPKHDLRKLYNEGKITDDEMSYLLSHPDYGIEKVLDGKGGYDLSKSLDNDKELTVIRDVGKDRMIFHKNTDFYREVHARGGRAVGGPSGTAFRMLKVGQLLAPALQEKMNNLTEEELHEVLTMQCFAYLVPDNHSGIEVEMAAQDVGALAQDQSIYPLFKREIHYGSGKDDRISQEMLDKELSKKKGG